jgi:hypothetical protein
MPAKRKEPIPTRYVVEWHPTAAIEAECVKLGQKPDDGTSFWDWVDIDDHVETRTFPIFDEAVTFALSIAGQDCFSGARIYRQVQIVIRDGKHAFIRWESECFWDGLNGDDKPDVEKPDQWMEAA